MGLFDRLRSGVRERESPTPPPATPARNPLALIDEGNALEDAGRFHDALARYDAAISLEPTLARGHLNRGNALLALGEPEEAARAYTTALVHDPDFAAAHFNLGNAYVGSNRRDDALGAYRRALALKPDFTDAEIALGAVYEDLGQRAAAAASYRRALQISPACAAAHSNLGNVLQEIGQLEDAIASYRRALELDPQLVMAQYGLGNALQANGRYADAVAKYRLVLHSNPEFAAALGNLGNALQALGSNDEAIASYRRALAIAPGEALLHVNLGTALRNVGETDEAVASFRRALQIVPDMADAHYNLGSALAGGGQLQDAPACYRRVLEIDPEHAFAHFGLANALKDDGRLDEAIASYGRALKFKPDLAVAHCNLGNVLRDKDRLDEAIASYRKAIECTPDFAEAISNLGDALKSKGLLAEAIACYEKALALKPDFAEAYFALGSVYLFQDRMVEAAGCFHTALSFKPDYAEPRWLIVEAQVPAVYAADDDPAVCRNNFSTELDKLEHWFDAARSAQHADSTRIQTPFHLAYQDEDNRDLLRRHGTLCARIMAAWPGRPAPVQSAAYRADRVLRVGIVSQHFRRHSVWRAIVKGWFEQLDRKRFALHAFYLGSVEDEDTRFAQSGAAAFVQGQHGLRGWAQAIVGQKLDVLIYPEIGMDSITGQLASLRLAPVQVSTWGHPETTGLPTIDYYLSAEELEPPAAQQNYTERLITLPGLGCFYKPYDIVAAQPDLAKLGINPELPLFVCPGTPFKYAPRHDHVFTEIARQLERCQFAFFDFDSSPNLSAKLRKRLEAAFTGSQLNLENFAVFVPWQTPAGFYGLLERADIFLDTIGFSGFNTAMQAVECALPIVTREGRFLRGRLASGILKKIGLDELVAQSDEEYIALAVRLARDADYRQRIGERIELSRHILLEDTAPIRALEDFLVQAATAANTNGGVRNGPA